MLDEDAVCLAVDRLLAFFGAGHLSVLNAMTAVQSFTVIALLGV